MKKLLVTVSMLVLLSGCTANINAPQSNTQNPSQSYEQTSQITTSPATAQTTCPQGQYSCACATGNYCLRVGAMCLSPSSACPATTPALAPATSTTKTFKSTAYNLQFDYPSTFISAETNYGDLENPIVQIQSSSEAYPKTNLNDASFTVSAGTASTLDTCLTMNPPENGTKFQEGPTINGTKFYTTTGNGAGAGNYYDMKVYRTFVSTKCFEIVETIHTSNIENFDPGTVTEINKTSIWAQLKDIFSTFKFTN